MGYSCRCGAVYADSDFEEFMQHAQKCNRGSKSGEGERAQPTPKGGKKAKGVVGGTAGDVDDGNDSNAFTCPLCSGTFVYKGGLKKHLGDGPGGKHKLKDKNRIEELMDEALRFSKPKDPESKCHQCGKVLKTVNFNKHLKLYCPATKPTNQPQRREVQAASRERAQPTPRGDDREASGSQNLNVSRDSLIERAENLNLCQPMALMTDDQFLNKFKAFMTDEKSTGHVKESTVKNYMIYIKNYGSYWKNENPNFSFGKLCLFGSEECLDPPSAEFWQPTLGNTHSRNMGINAFIKMLDFLSRELRCLKVRGKISKQALGEHQSELMALKEVSNGLLKRIQQQLIQEEYKKARQRDRLAYLDKEILGPGKGKTPSNCGTSQNPAKKRRKENDNSDEDEWADKSKGAKSSETFSDEDSD